MKYFLVGLGIGAVVGLAFAPAPGVETREKLFGKVTDSVDAARSAVQEATDNVKSSVKQGKKPATAKKATGDPENAQS
jgi:gas vesicle protein